MSRTDVIIQGYLFKYGTPLICVIILYMIVASYFESVRNKLYALYVIKCDNVYERMTKHYKKELFSPLHSLVSANWKLRNQGLIRILEIGVRTGQNLKYYPKNSHVILADRNSRLEKHFKSADYKKIDQLNVVKYIQSYGENLAEIPDESVDAVVATLVLCSAPDVDRMLGEIWRVLVPGGIYFFLEHIQEPDDPSLRRMQNILTKIKVWPYVFDGCHLNRNVKKNIKQIKFKEVNCDHLQFDMKDPYPLKFTRTHIIGTAIK
ncbi:thiol S-methyltransferase TMT1B [Anabrus simplex]|uniref:thiol S-methyltransferase TMT1B n=1 Tax=Anabrus simplex TaxID=316456 RepID=UPI0035A29A42